MEIYISMYDTTDEKVIIDSYFRNNLCGYDMQFLWVNSTSLGSDLNLLNIMGVWDKEGRSSEAPPESIILQVI